MNSTWFNLRVLFWHFQILRGDLFRVSVFYNPFWRKWPVLWRPIALYSCDLKSGWEYRGSDAYRPLSPK